MVWNGYGEKYRVMFCCCSCFSILIVNLMLLLLFLAIGKPFKISQYAAHILNLILWIYTDARCGPTIHCCRRVNGRKQKCQHNFEKREQYVAVHWLIVVCFLSFPKHTYFFIYVRRRRNVKEMFFYFCSNLIDDF